MEDLRFDKHLDAPLSETADAVAIGQAYNEAVDRLSKHYVIDDVARSKLIGLVVKIARKRMQSANYLADRADVETIAILSVRHFLQLRSGASDRDVV